MAQNDCRTEMKLFDRMAINTSVRITTDISVKARGDEDWRPYSHFDEERIFPDQWHLKSTRRDLPSWYEIVQAGGKKFYRENDSSWERKDEKLYTFGPETFSSYSPLGCTVLGIETIDGNRFKVFQWVKGRVPEAGRESDESGGWNRVWFDQNGRVYKKESLHFAPNNGPNRYIMRVERYEFNVDVKIESPLPDK